MSDIFHEGAVAVITGAASGIGAAAARRFASSAMKLVLVDRDEAKLKGLAGTLGGDAMIIVGDVAQMIDIERLREEAFAAFGRVDLLMNSTSTCGA